MIVIVMLSFIVLNVVMLCFIMHRGIDVMSIVKLSAFIMRLATLSVIHAEYHNADKFYVTQWQCLQWLYL